MIHTKFYDTTLNDNTIVWHQVQYRQQQQKQKQQQQEYDQFRRGRLSSSGLPVSIAVGSQISLLWL